MNVLQSLETYTAAQKGVGTNFVILGVVLIIIALAFFLFASKTPLIAGLRWGALIAGMFIAINGLIYRGYSDNTHKKSAAIFEKSEVEFISP